MKTIFLKVEINFENYEDVSDELILEDSGILDSLKNGVKVEIINNTNNQSFITSCPYFSSCINNGKNMDCNLQTFKEIDCYIKNEQK